MVSKKLITATVAASAVKAEPKKAHPGGTTLQAWDDGFSYIYWSVPFPAGATIISATLSVFTADAWNTSKTTWLQRLNQGWSASKMTWNNRPPMGTVLYQNSPGAPKNTRFNFDIKSLMQGVANGTPWYGVGFRTNHDNIHRIWSDSAPNTKLRPQINIVWSVPPNLPSGLSPSGGMVINNAKPRLIWGYTDRDGNTSMTALQVQVANNSAMSSGLWTSAIITTPSPMVDLSTTDYPGVAEGATVFWRARHRDDAGLWSGWSSVASFKRVGRGTTTITDPVDSSTTKTNSFLHPNLSKNTYYSPVGVGVVSAVEGQGISVITPASGASDSGILLIGNSPVTSGQTWTYSAEVTANVAETMKLVVSGTPGTASSGNVVFAAGETKRISVTIAHSASGTPTLSLLRTSVVATNSYVRDVMQEQAGTMSSFFSGDFEDDGDDVYNWAGEADNSVSTAVHTTPVTIRNPAPVISWSFTPPSGYVQAQYRVVVTDIGDGAIIYDTQPIVGTETAFQLPYGLLIDTTKTYRIEVRVLDSVPDRATVGGDSAWQTDYVLVDYSDVGLGTVTNIADLDATGNEGSPTWALTWSTAQAGILYFLIFRYSALDDTEILVDTVPRGLALDEGTTTDFTFLDNFVPGRSTFTWRVQSITQNDTGGSNTVTKQVRNKWPWLIPSADDGVDRKVAMLNASIDPALTEITDVVEPLEGDPILIVQKYGGFAGTGEGRLVNDLVNKSGGGLYTAQEMKQNFLWMRENPLVYLLWADQTILCYIYNCNYKSIPLPTGKTEYMVSFNFVQVNNL